MKATDVIRRDHRAAEELISEFKNAGKTERARMATKIFKALDTHEMMEDTYFYPALLSQTDNDPKLLAIEEEQEALKETVMRVREMKGEKRDEELLLTLDTVLEHAKREEREILPLAERAMGESLLAELGKKMEPRSAAAKDQKKNTSEARAKRIQRTQRGTSRAKAHSR